MSFFSNTFVGAALGILTLLQPASAQTVHGPEAPYSYDSVRGWDVYALSLKNGVHGCRAIKSGASGRLMIEKYQGEWNLIVPSRQGGRFTGGVVSIDGALIDSQFGLSNGYGIKTLTGSTLGKLKAGSTVTVRVNGDGNRSWSLAGSTAAILKVEECVNTGGEKPARASSTTAPQQDPPLVTNCRSITHGDYRCIMKYLDSAPGYVETVQISAAFNDAPRYFFKIRTGAQTADVWVGFGQEKWQFVGVWNLRDDGVQRCAEPAANQSAQARQALGQDAWQLCLN